MMNKCTVKFYFKVWKMEEGGWKLLLVISIESHCKIKLTKKDKHLLLIPVITSLFQLPASSMYNSN